MINRILQAFLAIPMGLAIFAVFVLTAGETALFLGFVIPGELIAILGGVLASSGRVPLAGVLAAAVAGPLCGDSIGYLLGRRYGRRFVSGKHRPRWAKARAWLRRRGAFAVFVGRFTAFLRSIIPAAAGAARLPYGEFLPWSAAACLLWGIASVLLGYYAGRNLETLAIWANRFGLVLLALALVGAGYAFVRRRHPPPRRRRRRRTKRRVSR